VIDGNALFACITMLARDRESGGATATLARGARDEIWGDSAANSHSIDRESAPS
jgi:hypothetical protein